MLCSLSVSSQNIVTIDKSKQYQKIDGFGTQYGKDVYWADAPYYDEDHLRRIIDELGISIHRTWIDPKLEIENDNNDANNTDLAKFKANLDVIDPERCRGEYVKQRDQIAYMKVYNERALKNGDTIKFYGSVITPPHWMKYVKCTFGEDGIWNRLVTSEEEASKGGTAEVIKDRKDEFAEWLYGTIRTWKDEGLDLYAVGIQNEPAFPQPYGSCVYSPEAMASVVGKVGARFDKENIKTKIIFPEDIGDVGRNNQYVISLNSNTAAKNYGHIFGVHQYNQDGVTPGSLAASTWTSLYKIAQRGAVRPVWMTETSGFGVGSQGMKKMYNALYTALKFGKVNAFNWYDATDGQETENATSFFIKVNGKQQFTKKGQAFRHYSKYIRPESICVDATCSTDADVLPLAFQDNYRKRLTIILINNDSVNTKTVSLKFTDNTAPKKLLGYITSINEDWKKIDSINIDAVITLPPSSISTYIGNNSKPVITALFNADKERENNQLSVYPNPSKGSFYIQGGSLESEAIQIKLLSIDGQELKTIDYPNDGNPMMIGTETLPAGLYLIKYNNKYQRIAIQ